jgi:hypothetical protein
MGVASHASAADIARGARAGVAGRVVAERTFKCQLESDWKFARAPRLERRETQQRKLSGIRRGA